MFWGHFKFWCMAIFCSFSAWILQGSDLKNPLTPPYSNIYDLNASKSAQVNHHCSNWIYTEVGKDPANSQEESQEYGCKIIAPQMAVKGSQDDTLKYCIKELM